MSQVYKRGTAKAEMNMTPLIDITFQLIIFFILTLNVASQEVVPMIVPRLEDPKTQESKQEERLVVNIIPMDYAESQRKDNPLAIEGEAVGIRVGQANYRIDQLDQVEQVLKDYAARRKASSKDQEPMVLLRADAAIYYAQVAPVMRTIAQAGIEKINLVAFLPDK